MSSEFKLFILSYKSLNGKLTTPSICLFSNSALLLTSKTLTLFNFSVSTKELADTDLSVNTSFLLFSQVLKLPSKYPMQLSYPTLESRAIASSSLPIGAIKRIF